MAGIQPSPQPSPEIGGGGVLADATFRQAPGELCGEATGPIQSLPLHVDVLIVGGGPVGALLAQKLAASHLKTLLLEARTEVADDARALALSWHSVEALKEAGLWDDAIMATTITRVQVSQQGSLGRTRLDADEIALPALGYVARYDALTRAAQARLVPGVAEFGVRVSAVRQLDGYAVAELDTPSGAQTMTARLVVLADGGSLVEQIKDVRQRVKPYQQHAILATLTPSEPHGQIAYERFADDGPLALLPNGRDFTLVWTQSPAQAQARLALSDADFIAAIEARLAGMTFAALGSRTHYPLALKTLDSVVGRRVALIGNAAQTLHPVAGQGLNLGLRDASTLAALLLQTPAWAVGSTAMLARYAALRRRDAGAVTFFTDSLIALFDRPEPIFKHARSLGLLALDLAAPARRAFARAMVAGWR